MTREQVGCICKQPCQQQVLPLAFWKHDKFNLHLSFSAAVLHSCFVKKSLCTRVCASGVSCSCSADLCTAWSEKEKAVLSSMCVQSHMQVLTAFRPYWTCYQMLPSLPSCSAWRTSKQTLVKTHRCLPLPPGSLVATCAAAEG